MSMSVSNVFIDMFVPEVKRAYAQSIPEIRQTVYDKGVIEGSRIYFPKAGKATATRMNRGSQVVPQDISFSRAYADILDYGAFSMVYRQDINKTNINEVEVTAITTVEALERSFGQVIIDTIANAADYTEQVGDDTTDMSVALFVEAALTLDNRAVPQTERYALLPVKAKQDLMEDELYVNILFGGFAPAYNRTEGFENIFGINVKFVPNQPDLKLPVASDGGLLGFVYHKRAIGFATNDDMRGVVEWVSMYRGWLVGAEGSYGCCAIDADGIVPIEIKA